MVPPRPALPFALRGLLVAGALLALAARLSAEGFTATLSPAQLESAGLAGLTPAERTALDKLVEIEVADSRLAEGVVLSGTFESRRTAEERRAAGLDRLSADQLARLNQLIVAAQLAHPRPKERPRIRDDSVIYAKPKPEVHGSLTLSYGRSADGRVMHGTDFWVNYTIPDFGLTLGFGLSRHSGGSPYDDYYPGIYGPRLSHARYPLLLDAANRGLPGDDLVFGTDESIRVASPLGSLEYSQHHE